MKTSDLQIEVPKELIAQEPANPRDSSRLLRLDRKTGNISFYTFRDLVLLLKRGDCLVFNDSRVATARFKGHIKDKPMEGVSILFLKHKMGLIWEVELETGEVEERDIIVLDQFSFEVERKIEKIGRRQETLLEVQVERGVNPFDLKGDMPLPPYIHSYKGDMERYQTVYSKIVGSAACPTAGLHFTMGLLEDLRKVGIDFAFVTLHVGLDTFMPIYEDDPKDHKMYTEWCKVTQETAEFLNETRKKGNRVIGVGTTAVRTLESCHSEVTYNQIDTNTGIYILPGYTFQSIDAMITNFHYPRSTNLAMVSAFAGYENIKKAYNEAVEEKMRFYSFGDSMFIV